MGTIECAACSKTFRPQRSTAKYCSSNCRVRATRARKVAAAVLPHVEGARIITLAPAPRVEELADSSFVAVTTRLLKAAGRLDSYQGVSALFAARLLDSGVQDTMSSMARMLGEYKATMKEALDGAQAEADPLAEIMARRRSA